MSAYYRHHRHSNSGQGTPLPKGFWTVFKLVFVGLGLLFVGIAVVSFVAGGLNFSQQEAFFAKAEPATGTITAYELYVRNSGLSEYCPRIEYSTKAGEPFAYQGSDCPDAPDSSKIGQQVQLYYDPKNPKDHRTKGFGTEYTGLTVGLIAGVFFLGMGVFMFVLGFGIAGLGGLVTANQAAKAQGYAAAGEAEDRKAILARGGSEADVEEWLQKRRRQGQ